MTAYAHRKFVPLPYAEALARTRQALAEHGFGVPAEMDTQAIFRTKLGKESAPRMILGACLPAVAFEALMVEPDIAVLLPCNVVVRQVEGGCEVTTIDPKVLFTLTENVDPAHAEVVDGLLRQVLNAI
jgi:uncharacterized protein (DUF302 family)